MHQVVATCSEAQQQAAKPCTTVHACTLTHLADRLQAQLQSEEPCNCIPPTLHSTHLADGPQLRSVRPQAQQHRPLLLGVCIRAELLDVLLAPHRCRQGLTLGFMHVSSIEAALLERTTPTASTTRTCLLLPVDATHHARCLWTRNASCSIAAAHRQHWKTAREARQPAPQAAETASDAVRTQPDILVDVCGCILLKRVQLSLARCAERVGCGRILLSGPRLQGQLEGATGQRAHSSAWHAALSGMEVEAPSSVARTCKSRGYKSA